MSSRFQLGQPSFGTRDLFPGAAYLPILVIDVPLRDHPPPQALKARQILLGHHQVGLELSHLCLLCLDVEWPEFLELFEPKPGLLNIGLATSGLRRIPRFRIAQLVLRIIPLCQALCITVQVG